MQRNSYNSVSLGCMESLEESQTPVPQSSLLTTCQTTETFQRNCDKNHKRYIWRGVNKAYGKKCTIPTVKHRSGFIMFMGLLSYTGTGNLVRINWKSKECFIKKLLEKKNLSAAAHGMHLDHPAWHWSKTKGQVNLSLATEEKSEGSGVVISVSWPQYYWASLGRSQMCSPCDSPII